MLSVTNIPKYTQQKLVYILIHNKYVSSFMYKGKKMLAPISTVKDLYLQFLLKTICVCNFLNQHEGYPNGTHKLILIKLIVSVHLQNRLNYAVMCMNFIQ
jgi:hypothetical protein